MRILLVCYLHAHISIIMGLKTNYICGKCQKITFTKNSSLKRHRVDVHLSTRYNCLTCLKTYKHRDDMVKHSKKCLKNKLNEGYEENQPPLDHPSSTREVPHNAPLNAVTDILQDLTVRGSEDEEIKSMASKIESKLIGNTLSRQKQLLVISALVINPQILSLLS